MSESSGWVFVIDDDPAMRDILETLVSSVGLQAATFHSTEEFRQTRRPGVPSCLILDVRLPGTSGLDFQRHLTTAKDFIPVIFITGYGDIAMCVQAMKLGAVDFLTKPFRNQDVLDAIHQALERDRLRRSHEAEVAALRKRVDQLTPRERQVLPLVVSGLLNKQIAAEIGISEAAVKVHRNQLMHKLGAESIAKLVRMALRLGIPEL
jgi:FixJ family two-component response regulator